MFYSIDLVDFLVLVPELNLNQRNLLNGSLFFIVYSGGLKSHPSLIEPNL